MDADRAATLRTLITTIQRRWGQRALRIFGQPTAEALAVLPTGFAELDRALGIGGLPRGRMSELLGMPTSGKTTIALRTLAQAQAQGDHAGYVDLPATFDPEYAAWCGVNLADLLLVRPRTAADALDLIPLLVASGGLGMLLVDDLASLQVTTEGAVRLDRMLRVLAGSLAASPCALVVLTTLPYRAGGIATIGFRGSALAYAAALRLHVAREAWLDNPTAPPGCHARITVLKHKLAASGAAARVTITFDDDWKVI
jgi:recombination protein RecA